MSSELKEVFENNAKFDSQKEIITRLLDDNNLETKTELDKPLRFSVLHIFQEKLKENHLNDSSIILERFLNYSFKYLISKNRQGRKEYIEALQMINQSNILTKEPNPLSPLK